MEYVYVDPEKVREYANALDIVCEKLKNDEEMFYAFQANIAMAFIDESGRQESRDSYSTRHSIANKAAKNFLNLLIRD